MLDCTIIGLTGPMGAGKSIVSGILSDLSGFDSVTLSFYVRRLAEQRGIEVTRESLQMVGTELREQGGAGAIAAFALRDIAQRSDITGVIIDGIRSMGEIDALLSGCRRFFLIGVDAPPELRFDRQLARGYLVAGDRAHFTRQDEWELGLTPGGGFEIAACLERARSEPWGRVLCNRHGIEELTAEVEAVWEWISTA